MFIKIQNFIILRLLYYYLFVFIPAQKFNKLKLINNLVIKFLLKLTFVVYKKKTTTFYNIWFFFFFF